MFQGPTTYFPNIASSKLWFTWLWYNIACKIFMFFNMSIGIVKFAMIWKLTPFLTRIWLLPSFPFQGPFFYIIMLFFFNKTTHSKHFHFMFCNVIHTKPHLHLPLPHSTHLIYFWLFKFQLYLVPKYKGMGSLFLVLRLVLHETFSMLFKLDLMGVPCVPSFSSTSCLLFIIKRMIFRVTSLVPSIGSLFNHLVHFHFYLGFTLLGFCLFFHLVGGFHYLGHKTLCLIIILNEMYLWLGLCIPTLSIS